MACAGIAENDRLDFIFDVVELLKLHRIIERVVRVHVRYAVVLGGNKEQARPVDCNKCDDRNGEPEPFGVRLFAGRLSVNAGARHVMSV